MIDKKPDDPFVKGSGARCVVWCVQCTEHLGRRAPARQRASNEAVFLLAQAAGLPLLVFLHGLVIGQGSRPHCNRIARRHRREHR